MKDNDLMYFAFAFIVGMFIHYNMKEICKGRGFLLEGSTTPEVCKTPDPNCRPGIWWNSGPVEDGYCADPKSTKKGTFCWF